MSRAPLARRAPAIAAAALGVTAILALAVLIDGRIDRLGRADVGVVLGMAVGSDLRPSPPLQARCDRAVDVYRRGWVRRIIASGAVYPPFARNEARVMGDYLVSRGIPPEHVIEDSLGSTTWHSAANTRAWLDAHGLRSAMAISEDYHLPRCRLAFRRWGIEPVYSAHARHRAWRNVYATLRELPALAKYALRPGPRGRDRQR